MQRIVFQQVHLQKMTDEIFMNRCIELARMGTGFVAPNPLVGAVIVHEDKIIGEGYHQQYGQAHAEVNAINMVLKRYEDGAKLLQQSTLYVNLEPCAHHGKTPPCADLILHHKIPKVVIGMEDPFEKVQGLGIKKLKDAGVQVIVPVLEKECKELNKRFLCYHQHKRPYIILKWAETADGFFAPEEGSKKWISSEMSRILVHKWRSEEVAILVGTKTVKIDDPQLNVRLWGGSDPVRIIIDKDLSLSSSYKIFDDSQKTIIINYKKSDWKNNTRWLKIEEGNYLPQYILYQLYLLDIQSVLIEGGAFTLKSFIDSGLWDEARIFKGKQVWTSGIHAPVIPGKALYEEACGEDLLYVYQKQH